MTEQEIRDKYLGIPYKHLGRDLSGTDCWGLIYLVYKDFGVKVFDLKNYDEHWALRGNSYFVEYYYGDWEKVGSPKLLDVLLFRNSKFVPAHAGIYLSKGRFLHSGKCSGVVIGKKSKWVDRLEGIYRNKKLR